MFKKLQNLLFEDDEDDINQEEHSFTQNTQQVPVKPVQMPAAQPVVQPQQVTASPAPVVQPTVTPAHVTSAPAASTLNNVQEVKKPTLGLTVDDGLVEKKKTVKPTVKPAVKAVATPVKKETTDISTNYQFRPVISPIFGVDEKDVTSLKNTTNKIKNAKQAKKDQNITPVLSPMYGVASEDTVVIKDEEDVTTDLLSQINANASAKEDDIPEFSLDDILKVRDEEFAEDDRSVKEDDAPLFPDLTFDDEDAPLELDDNEDIPTDLPANMPSDVVPDDSSIDNTVVIKQQLFDDDEN